jgi:hypothetical protein
MIIKVGRHALLCRRPRVTKADATAKVVAGDLVVAVALVGGSYGARKRIEHCLFVDRQRPGAIPVDAAPHS